MAATAWPRDRGASASRRDNLTRRRCARCLSVLNRSGHCNNAIRAGRCATKQTRDTSVSATAAMASSVMVKHPGSAASCSTPTTRHPRRPKKVAHVIPTYSIPKIATLTGVAYARHRTAQGRVERAGPGACTRRRRTPVPGKGPSSLFNHPRGSSPARAPTSPLHDRRQGSCRDASGLDSTRGSK